MEKLGVGKVEQSITYRVLETQESYIKNLTREKKRKRETINQSEVMRYLLDLGIRTHREGRREKFEMSHYFRAELRTFTENFFKENDKNYIFRLVEITRYVRFVTLLLLEILRLLNVIYFLLKDQSPFDETHDDEFKKDYFKQMETQGKTQSDLAVGTIQEELGNEGEEIRIRLETDKGKSLEIESRIKDE